MLGALDESIKLFCVFLVNGLEDIRTTHINSTNIKFGCNRSRPGVFCVSNNLGFACAFGSGVHRVLQISDVFSAGLSRSASKLYPHYKIEEYRAGSILWIGIGSLISCAGSRFQWRSSFSISSPTRGGLTLQRFAASRLNEDLGPPCHSIPIRPSPCRDNVALLTVVDVLSAEIYEDRVKMFEDGTRRYHQGGDSVRSPAAGGVAPPQARSSFVSGRGGGSLHSPPLVEARAARLVIANTHLLFNPKRGDIKTAQLMMLTGRVER